MTAATGSCWAEPARTNRSGFIVRVVFWWVLAGRVPILRPRSISVSRRTVVVREVAGIWAVTARIASLVSRAFRSGTLRRSHPQGPRRNTVKEVTYRLAVSKLVGFAARAASLIAWSAQANCSGHRGRPVVVDEGVGRLRGVDVQGLGRDRAAGLGRREVSSGRKMTTAAAASATCWVRLHLRRPRTKRISAPLARTWSHHHGADIAVGTSATTVVPELAVLRALASHAWGVGSVSRLSHTARESLVVARAAQSSVRGSVGQVGVGGRAPDRSTGGGLGGLDAYPRRNSLRRRSKNAVGMVRVAVVVVRFMTAPDQ